MKHMTNSKSGAVTLIQAIGLVMGFIGLLVLFGLSYKITSPFLGKRADDATKNNFDELTDKVQEMLDSKKDVAFERFFPYYIAGDYAFMVFGARDDSIYARRGMGYGNPYQLLKPNLCAGKACLCLYKNIKSKELEALGKPETKDDNVFLCKSFEGDITFFTVEKETDPIELFIGGIQDIVPPTFHPGANYLYIAQKSIPNKKVQNFYMERLERNDEIYFFITIEDTETENRYNSLKS